VIVHRVVQHRHVRVRFAALVRIEVIPERNLAPSATIAT